MVIRRAVLDLQGRRTVYDTKTHALRWVRINAETARLLRAQRDSARELAEAAGVEFSTDDFVFPRSPGSGEPLPPNRIGQAWRRLCREVGVEARLHDLRHLQASLLLDAGEAITTVSARLGHRDTSTTLKIYSHLMPGADQRAAGDRRQGVRSAARRRAGGVVVADRATSLCLLRPCCRAAGRPT